MYWERQTMGSAPGDNSTTLSKLGGHETIPRHDMFPDFSDDTMSDLFFYFMGVTMTILSIGGTGINCLSSVVFVKQGLANSPSNICFLYLTLSDLGTNIFMFVISACFVLDRVFLGFRIDFISMSMLLATFTRQMFSDISVLLTVVISVHRSICVVLPFRANELLTVNKSVYINSGVAIFVVICYIPIFATQGVSWQFDPRFNKTRLLLLLSENRMEVEQAVNILNSVVLTFAAQIVVMVSSVVLVIGLRNASVFKKSSHFTTVPTKNSKKNKTSRNLAAENSSVKDSSKDTKVVKMIFLISVSFTVCNMPYVITVFLQAIEPGFNLGGPYEDFLFLFYMILCLTFCLNGIVNVFVYYSYSTKFQQTFKALFCS